MAQSIGSIGRVAGECRDAIPLERTPTNLRALLDSTIEPLRDEARRLDVSLRLSVWPAVPDYVTLDADKVAWALATLIGNALRYAKRGTRLMPGGAVYVEVQTARDAIVFIVRDDGPGIPERKLLWLFKRAPDRPHAAGLALKLIGEIATAHGGTLAIQSNTAGLNHGTTATIEIPIGGSPAQAVQRPTDHSAV